MNVEPVDVRTHPDILVRDEGDNRHVIVHRTTGRVYVASPTAALILTLAREPVHSSGIAAEFAARFPDVSPEELNADLDVAIKGMLAVGLLESVNDG